MYRFLSIISLVLVPFISSGQTEGEELRNQFNQFYDSGRYDEALLKVAALKDWWKSKNNADSIAFYTYRHAHTLGVMGMPSESIAESEKLVINLESNPPLPSFMGSLYFTYGSNLLYLSEFSKAKETLDKSIAFEEQRKHPDTLTIAKATEWKGLVGIYTDDIEQARLFVEEALSLRYAIFDSTAKEIAYNLNSLASVYDELGLKAKAGEAYAEAYRILAIHLPADHPHLLSVASNLSVVKSDMGQIDEALSLLQGAIAVHEKQGAYYSLMNEYHNMGTIYSMLEDYEKARIYLTKGLNLADSLLPKPHFYRANMYDGLGAVFYSEGNNNNADSLFYLALLERQAATETSLDELGQSAFNLALTSQDRSDTAKAYSYYLKSYDLRKKAFGENHPKTANSLFGLADMEWWQGKHNEAFKNYRKCLSIYLNTVTDQNQWTLESLIHLGERFHEIDEPDSTRRYIQKAWTAVCNHPNGGQVNIAKLSEYTVEYLDPYVLNLINFHLNVLLSKKHLTGQKSFEEGVELMKTMDGLMVQLWPFLNFESENNTTLPLIKTIYRKGVLLASMQPNVDDNIKSLYLNSFEQSRSASIRSALQNRAAMNYANVPDTVVEKDRRLREELRFVQAKAKDEQDEYWTKLRFETLNKWRNYQTYLHTAYPEWYELRYAPKIPAAAEVQGRLAEINASLVAYFDADTAMAVLVANGDNFTTTLLQLPPSWQDSVRTYRLLIEQRARPERVAALSLYLYTLLWHPIEPHLHERVLLIPDGALNFLNFETLITEPAQSADYANWSWLIKKHTIILRNTLPGLKKQVAKSNGQILAMAPGFSDELKASYINSLPFGESADSTFTSWVQTPWSVEFAKELKPRGMVLVGTEANEKSFRENADKAGILHFGTHAQLQDANPLLSYLALTPKAGSDDDGYLYAYELYNQPLKANLAVLTACETGLGAYREGDGVISLAHAFQYAGCPNVVYSLWQIDDKQSTWIMKQFYSHIDQEMAYSDALRQAKLDYLTSHTGELAAPYYWGGVVITGEDGELEKTSSLFAHYGWPVGIAVGMLGLAVVFVRRKKKGV